MFHVKHIAVYCVRMYMYAYRRQMKRKKRVRGRGRVASLRASGGVEQGRSTNDVDWRERQLELKRWRRLPKKRVTLNLDADVLAWFRGMGRGYQWEINKALRRVMTTEKQAATSDEL
jgi:uncharacterized protein (DUF4415 family)